MLLGRNTAASTLTPGRLAPTTVKDWVQRWRQAGVLESSRLLVGQPSSVWLTRAGLSHLELDYRLWEPKACGVADLHAVNQTRLWVEAREPEAQWRSERRLRSGRAFQPAPDAEVELRGQRVAIEVERSAKTARHLQAILYELVRTYAGVWYFCPPATQGMMQRAIQP